MDDGKVGVRLSHNSHERVDFPILEEVGRAFGRADFGPCRNLVESY